MIKPNKRQLNLEIIRSNNSGPLQTALKASATYSKIHIHGFLVRKKGLLSINFLFSNHSSMIAVGHWPGTESTQGQIGLQRLRQKPSNP